MTRTSNSITNHALLEAALEGLKSQRSRIDEQIAHVENLLGRRRGKPASAEPIAAEAPKTRRELSPAARKRIAAAQKKRWADYRKKTPAG
jgi:hypothetical protein